MLLRYIAVLLFPQTTVIPAKAGIHSKTASAAGGFIYYDVDSDEKAQNLCILRIMAYDYCFKERTGHD